MKESYYFSHDTNARNDPKILAMRSKYKYEGYGWYFAFIEMMREQADGKLSMRRQCDFDAFAMQLQCDAETIKIFINDCISEYDLFIDDGMFFWSESLLRRMELAQDKKIKAQNSAKKRWETKDIEPTQCDSIANALPTHSERNASKGNKVKEIKESKKDIYAPLVTFTKEEHQKLIDKLGLDILIKKIEDLSLYKQSTGKKYASDYATILAWDRKEEKTKKEQPQGRLGIKRDTWDGVIRSDRPEENTRD